ncbi:MAG: TspO/MBR family protein [Ardenticatenaceae bacterium]
MASSLVNATKKNWQALALSIFVPVSAAILGNGFISENAMIWYDQLNHPWYKLPLWGSVIIAFLLYIGYGVIIYRTFSQRHYIATLAGALVLFGNEIWNIFFFGTRNLSLTFWVTVLFALLVLIQTATVYKKDRLSFAISLIYLMWVVLYDVPWLYQLSMTN